MCAFFFAVFEKRSRPCFRPLRGLTPPRMLPPPTLTCYPRTHVDPHKSHPTDVTPSLWLFTPPRARRRQQRTTLAFVAKSLVLTILRPDGSSGASSKESLCIACISHAAVLLITKASDIWHNLISSRTRNQKYVPNTNLLCEGNHEHHSGKDICSFRKSTELNEQKVSQEYLSAIGNVFF